MASINVEKLQDIVMTINSLQNRTLSIERLLTGQDLHTLQVGHMVPKVIGRMMFIHKLNLYVHSMLERQIRLYKWLLCHLQDLLDSIGILSTGHLPPELFPPTVLQNVTANAIEMVHKTHPDYTLAIRHMTEYHDMKLAMFGLDSDGSMIVAFPVFVKDHASEPKTLDRYRVPKFPHSSATFNILSGFHILASPKVLQGAFGDSTCPMWCSQPCPMLANRHLTGLTWFPIVLYYIK